MREAEAGKPLGRGELALGRFAFDPTAFARAGGFIRAALSRVDGRVDALGLDEIGALELARGEGLRTCLDLALAAAVRDGGPRLLVLAARIGESADRLRDLARASGLAASVFGAAEIGPALAAARLALA
jgi:hypothetical protein